MMMRAALYCRISRDREGAGLGVDRQREDCKTLADRLGAQVAAVHTDNDISAYSGKRRPGYQALLADMAAGRLDAVVVWHPDRLHRSNRELEGYIALSEKHHVLTHSVRSGLIDMSTPTGRMSARIVGAVAQHESEHKAERIARKRAQSAAAGLPTATWRAFGYERDKRTACPVEAAAVVRAAEMVIAGASLRSVSRVWNDAGLRSVHGNPFTPEAVPSILCNPRYAGLSVSRGEIVGQGQWDAILPEDQWRAVEAILTDPTRRTAPGNARRHLLSGVARCGVCGARVRVAGGARVGAHGHGGHRPRYRCETGSHVSRRVAATDELVVGVVLARLARPDAAELLATRDDGPDASALSAQAMTLRARLDDLSAAFADGEISRSQLRAGTERLRGKLTEVEERMVGIASVSPLGSLVGAPDPAAVWDGLDLGRRQAIIATLCEVTIDVVPKGRPKIGEPIRGVRITRRTA